MWRDLPQDKKPKFFQIASHEGPEPAKTWWTEDKARNAGENEAEQAEEEEPFPKIHGCFQTPNPKPKKSKPESKSNSKFKSKSKSKFKINVKLKLILVGRCMAVDREFACILFMCI